MAQRLPAHMAGLDGSGSSNALERASVAIANLLVWSEALPVLAELSRRGVPFIVLKSLPQVEELYGHAGGRRTGDVDLLVPGDRAAEALTIACELGWTLERPRQLAALTQTIGAGPAAARLPWHLLAPTSGSTAGMIDLHSDAMERWRAPPLDDRVWERASAFNGHEVPFLILCPEDRLIYLCWHFIWEGLPWWKLGDIQRILRDGRRLDWGYIAERCEATGMLTAVRLVCETAARRSSEPLTPHWRTLPVTARYRVRFLIALAGRIHHQLDQHRLSVLRICCYDRPDQMLAAIRAAALPTRDQLAGYRTGFDAGRHGYVAGLLRHYHGQLRRVR